MAIRKLLRLEVGDNMDLRYLNITTYFYTVSSHRNRIYKGCPVSLKDVYTFSELNKDILIH